ncbi:amylo-alpha-1,6-glucosidase [Cytophaga aurantiaca]|uniref:amylo-alpha-1,6-glucosidase n=1 Tax=Cytophaga aurantiaca TaxID=29530 RepID=UPI000366337D|nr:amylo-alpha-1,6-glucosidase [Cytophaga aurantiaca]
MLRLDNTAIQTDVHKLFYGSSSGKLWEGAEWIETNGLGGWAGSSLSGCNTRRYHGLLVAATKPPTERTVLVNKLDEIIVLNDEWTHLSTNKFREALSPQGYQHLSEFKKDLFPEFTFEANGVVIRKTIAMLHGENTTVIIYNVLQAPSSFTFKLLPLISSRDYHSLHKANDVFDPTCTFEDGLFTTQPYASSPEIFISIPNASLRKDPNWFYQFDYAVDRYRGLECEEDLFNHGTFSLTLNAGDSFGIILSTANPTGRDAFYLYEQERLRRVQLLDGKSTNTTIQQLTLSANQFVVQRSESLKTVIAGYHWFTDWGRDTMIALPGLCLTTGKFDDARRILKAFAESVQNGMIPNRFKDGDEAPEYNNVDGTLWYFVAVYRYLQTTQDRNFVLNEILPVLKDIVDHHFKGTLYNIKVDEDGLLYAGEVGQQLTWMDAKVGDWVVTPRMGKPVEIQALWYNSLKIFAHLLDINYQSQDASAMEEAAQKVKDTFATRFWNQDGNYLYDLIDENNQPDNSIRPNQLFAISLPFQLLEGEKAQAVFNCVEEHLYTPVGLRSLSPHDQNYYGIYQGDWRRRDASYHQGTVWSWLLGPYVDVMMRVGGEHAYRLSQKVIYNFAYHLEESCIGSVSEIFDGDAPHHPRGCVAQAWGVSEVLRVIDEYNL